MKTFRQILLLASLVLSVVGLHAAPGISSSTLNHDTVLTSNGTPIKINITAYWTALDDAANKSIGPVNGTAVGPVRVIILQGGTNLLAATFTHPGLTGATASVGSAYGAILTGAYEPYTAGSPDASWDGYLTLTLPAGDYTLRSTSGISHRTDLKTTDLARSAFLSVESAPLVTISPTDKSITEGESIQFTAAGSTTGNYTWGGSASGTGPGTGNNVTFPNPGSYTVTVQDPGGFTVAPKTTTAFGGTALRSTAPFNRVFFSGAPANATSTSIDSSALSDAEKISAHADFDSLWAMWVADPETSLAGITISGANYSFTIKGIADSTYTVSAGYSPGSYVMVSVATTVPTASAATAASNVATATITVLKNVGTPKSLVSVAFADTTYNGVAQTPSVASVSPSDATYDLSYSATNAGTYSVTITGNGSYAGSTATSDWKINKANAATPVLSPGDQTIFGGNSVSFTASGGSTGTYSWDGTAGATGVGALKPIEFLSLGTFTVSVKDPGNDNYNSSGSATATITVIPAPTTFSFANLSHAYDGTKKTATVTSSPSGATHADDLERGPDAGSYTVSATANGLFIGTGSATLVIAPATPVVSVSPASATVSLGDSVTFTAAGGQNAYVWGGDAPGINPAGGSSQALTFPSLGTYSVTVYSKAGGNYSQSNAATATVTVVPAPVTFVFSNLTQVYDGTLKKADVVSTPSDATYTPSLTSALPDVGGYPVSAKAYGSYWGSGNATLTIVPATPNGVAITPVVSTITAGDSITFTASGGQNGYIWGGNASGSGTTKTVVFPSAGSYFVTVYSPSGGNYNQSNTATATIIVNTIPATFAFINTLAVYDGTVKSAGVVPTPSDATYTADVTKGPDVGSYTITATATGAYSGSGSNTLTIVPAAPTVSLTPPSASILVGQSAAFVASGGQNSYVWGGSASGSGDTQTLTFGAPGIFLVSVYSTAGGNYDTSNLATALVTVSYPAPAINLSIDCPTDRLGGPTPVIATVLWGTSNISYGTLTFSRVLAPGTSAEREILMATISSTDPEYISKAFTGALPNTLTIAGDYRARLTYMPIGGKPGDLASSIAQLTMSGSSGTVLTIGKDANGKLVEERTTLQDNSSRGKATFISKAKN